MTTYIPVQDSSSYVLLPSSICHTASFHSIEELLLRELSPISLWHRVALQYYKNGHSQQFQQLLMDAHNVSKTQRYINADKGRLDTPLKTGHSESDHQIYILVALASYHAGLAIQNSDSVHLLAVEFGHTDAFLKKAEGLLHISETTKSSKAELSSGISSDSLAGRAAHFYVWICRGYYYLLQSAHTEDTARQLNLQNLANAQFSLAVQHEPNHFLAHIGMGELQALTGQYWLALKSYCQALLLASTADLFPQLAVSIRYSISICLIHTQQYGKAIAMLKRCLELDENHAPSHLALATLLNSRNCGDDTKVALQNIEKVYAADSSNPQVRIYLANHLFLSGHFEEAESILNETKLTTSGLQRTSSTALMAEMHFQLGRLLHVKKLIGEAYTRYKKAYDMRPSHASTLFNLAKCAIWLTRPMEAKDYLGLMLKNGMQNYEVFKLLSYVELLCAVKAPTTDNQTSNHSTKVKKEAASTFVQSLKNVANIVSKIVEPTFLDFPLLCIQIRAFESLIVTGEVEIVPACVSTYSEIYNYCQQMKESGKKEGGVFTKDKEPFDLLIQQYNNYGVLLTVSNRFVEAKNIFDSLKQKVCKCLKSPKSSTAFITRCKSAMIIVDFNLAVLNEYCCNYSAASALHKDLNTRCPQYVAPWIKRILFALERSDFDLAESYCMRAMNLNTKVGEPFLLLALMYHQRRLISKSVEILERGMKNVSNGLKNDMYACTYLGALQLELSKERPEKAAKLVSDALHNFRVAAAKPHKHRVYAANGLAVILAEHSMTLRSWDCFRLLMERSSGYFRYVVNRNMGLLLGAIALTSNADIKPGNHVEKLDPQKYQKAYSYYLTALESRPMDKEIHLLLGRFLHDCMKFSEAIELLQVAQIKWPNDIIISFNLIVCMDALIVRELRPEAKIEDPNVMLELLHMSEYVANSLEGLITLRKQWLSEKRSSVHCEQADFLQRVVTPKKRKGLYLITSPYSLNKLPEVPKLQLILSRYKSIYIPNAKNDLPEIEQNWIKAFERKEQIKMEQQLLRKQKEEMELKKRETHLLAEKWQQDRAAHLMMEANETAARIIAKQEALSQDRGSRAKAMKMNDDWDMFIDEGEGTEPEKQETEEERRIRKQKKRERKEKERKERKEAKALRKEEKKRLKRLRREAENNQKDDLMEETENSALMSPTEHSNEETEHAPSDAVVNETQNDDDAVSDVTNADNEE